jgi:hypothetical protein
MVHSESGASVFTHCLHERDWGLLGSICRSTRARLPHWVYWPWTPRPTYCFSLADKLPLVFYLPLYLMASHLQIPCSMYSNYHKANAEGRLLLSKMIYNMVFEECMRSACLATTVSAKELNHYWISLRLKTLKNLKNISFNQRLCVSHIMFVKVVESIENFSSFSL